MYKYNRTYSSSKIWCKQTYNESLPIALVGESILRDEIQGDKQKVYELALDDIKIISSLEYVLEEIYQDEVDIFSGNEYLSFLKKHNLKDSEESFQINYLKIQKTKIFKLIETRFVYFGMRLITNNNKLRDFSADFCCSLVFKKFLKIVMYP